MNFYNVPEIEKSNFNDNFRQVESMVSDKDLTSFSNEKSSREIHKVYQLPIETCNESTSTKKRAGRLCKQKKINFCDICGDKALSCNFDALTCESCKAFFRRNAFKNINDLKCVYSRNCEINITTRRLCKRCRLVKCFHVGMKRQYILSSEEKIEKRAKIIQNRIIKKLEEREWLPKDLSISGLLQRDLLTESDIETIDELIAAYIHSLRIKMDNRKGSRTCPNMLDLVNLSEISIRRSIEMFKSIGVFKKIEKKNQIYLLKSSSIEILVLRGILCYDLENQYFLENVDNVESDRMTIKDLFVATGLKAGSMLTNLIELLLHKLCCCRVTLLLLIMICLFSERVYSLNDEIEPEEAVNKEKGISPNASQFYTCPKGTDCDVNTCSVGFNYVPNFEMRRHFESIMENYAVILRRYLSTKYNIPHANIIFSKLITSLMDLRLVNNQLSERVKQESLSCSSQDNPSVSSDSMSDISTSNAHDLADLISPLMTEILEIVLPLQLSQMTVHNYSNQISIETQTSGSPVESDGSFESSSNSSPIMQTSFCDDFYQKSPSQNEEEDFDHS